MAVETYQLRRLNVYGSWEQGGAILVCSTSGRVVNLPIATFADEDEADDFVEWCRLEPGVGDPRSMGPAELEAAVEGWRADRTEQV